MMFSQISIGALNVLLFAAGFAQRDASFFRQKLIFNWASLRAFFFLLALMVAICLIGITIGEEKMTWLMRSPFVVLPAWIAILWAIARRGAAPPSTPSREFARRGMNDVTNRGANVECRPI